MHCEVFSRTHVVKSIQSSKEIAHRHPIVFVRLVSVLLMILRRWPTPCPMLESKKEYMILAKSQPINPPYETGRYVSFSGNCD
jgi:hypothetical protein